MNFSYQTGGSLDLDEPTYIKRKADEDLYARLLAGTFCYVLTSRQMGKSSLRIRVMDRLQQSGVRCIPIDLTGIGSQNISASEWYYGIIELVIEHLKLTDVIDLDEFWKQYQNLSPLQRLSKFVDMLLSHISEPVVVFVDEIDSTIDLKFDADDFFIWIRYCYNFRRDKPQYNRLTFCLLGVATPTDLIQDKTRTPFNIGWKIKPQQFQVNQLMPLMDGLAEQFEDIEAVCKVIHDWTGGQPYLTQRICQLIQSELGKIELGQEAESIARLVENRIITNWEYQDEQSHLKTIRDRLLKDDERAVRLLGLYQQVLQGAELSGDNFPERMALLLTGLVVISDQERLFSYNEIYRRVFSDEWIAQELAKLRPYAESLRQWLANSRDDRYLLTGQGFLDAQQWSSNRRLTEEDLQYLAASQKLHTEDVQATADAIIRQTKSEAAQITQRAKKTANIYGIAAVLGVIGSVAISWVSLFNSNEVAWRTHIEQASNEALVNFPESSLERAIAAMKVGRELKQKVKGDPITKYPTYAPLTFLQQAIATNWHETNRLAGHQDTVFGVAVSADGQTFVSGSEDRTVKIWKKDGSLVATLKGHQDNVTTVAVSADGQTIVSGSDDNTIKVWRRNGSLVTTIKGYEDWVTEVVISADGQTIVAADRGKTVKVWRRDGSLITIFKTHYIDTSNMTYEKRIDYNYKNVSVGVSADGQTIVSGNDDKTVTVWRRNGSFVATLIGHQDWVNKVAISADGQTIVSGSDDKTVKVWRRDGSLIATLVGHQAPITGVRVSADGQVIVSGSDDKTVKVWRKDGSLIATLTGGHHSSIYQLNVGVSADGRTIVSGSGDKTVKVWRDTSPTTTILGRVVGVSGDGQTIVAENNGKTVKVWQQDGSLSTNLINHKDFGTVLGMSADGQTIVAKNDDKTVKVWQPDGSLISTLIKNDRRNNSRVGVSADGQTIVVGSDYSVTVWRRNGSFITTLSGYQAPFAKPLVRDGDQKDWTGSLVGISADGQTIVSGSRPIAEAVVGFRHHKNVSDWHKTVKVWRPDGFLLATLIGHQAGVNGIRVSADGQTIVSGSDDRTVKVWRPNGSLITTLIGHQAEVTGVGVSADGQTIVSGSDDRTVKVWRPNGSLITTLIGHQSVITRVEVSADGRTIVTGSQDNTIKVWHLDLDYLLAKGCEQLKDYLNSHPEVNREEICPK
jgi:WD40 repeat protein